MSHIAGIDTILSDPVRSKSIPGVVAMAATCNEIIYKGGFGLLDINDLAPMTVDSTFCLASMTKLITSVAAMQLVEKQLIDLDEPAAKFAKDLENVSVLDGFDAAGVPRLRPPVRPVTLRHLLTHTSGLSYRYWNSMARDYQNLMQVPAIGNCQASSLRIPLVSDPGDQWEYGISTDWVGQIIEGVSGQRLDRYIKQYIFDPLEMNHSGFDLTPELKASISSLQFRISATTFESEEFADPENREFYDGGGGVFSNAPDYMKLLRMILSGGTIDRTRILRPETIADMSSNQIGNLNAGSLTTAEPERSNDFDLFPGTSKQWGLATMITPVERETGRSADSLCWGGMFNTWFWIDPFKDVAGVLMTQILPFADSAVLELCDEFERRVYGAIS